ncbi:nuclear transport factor 2 family protein [Caulobacter soli]|uniref:nuclear transport factor 2 family protein n=1 Tax=Caulobacter soli TaxID=2708539 RepID=UPI0013ED395A|nr:nuclear transport factor 2 family protein [Caulobacter soli]
MIERQNLNDLLVGRWCLGADTLNWKLYRSAFDDAVEMDFPDASNPSVSSSRVWRIDEWIAYARLLEGFDVTQHYLSNFRYQVTESAAEVSTYLIAEHHLGGRHFTLGGQSTHTLKRGAEGWKVVKVALTPWWTRGDQTLPAEAGARYAAGQAARSATAIL